MLKQAIIIAAGLGKRMGKLTYNKPKCLIQVFGQPILKYILDSLIEIDIERIIVVISEEWGNTIEQYIQKTYPKKYYPFLKVIFCCSPRKGVGYSLYCASCLVNFNAPTLITVSDLICFDGYSLFQEVLHVSDLVLATSNYRIESQKYTLASINSQGKLDLHNSKIETMKSYPLLGIYALKPVEKFFDYLSFSIKSVIDNKISKEEAISRKIINHRGEFRLSFVFELLNQEQYQPFFAQLHNCHEFNTPDDLNNISYSTERKE